MINLSLSEAYVFDMLAIASIKAMRVSRDDIQSPAWKERQRLEDAIISQIGPDLFECILNSPEYARLYEVNDQMFVRIDEMKLREPTGEDARYIDDRVFARFKAKQALQARWFPNEQMTETKHGYTGEEDKRV